MTNGQKQLGQLVRGEIAQHVGLVLGRVGPTDEFGAAGPLANLGVVARRNGVKAQSLGPLKEDVELDVAVALDAGVRTLPRGVAGDEGGDHVAIKLFGVVKDVVIDVEHLGHPSSVVDVRDRAAARVRGPAPELEGGAHHVVTGFL